MADAKYICEIELKMLGDLAAVGDIQAIEQHGKSAQNALHGISDAFTGAVEAGGRYLAMAGMVAGTALFAGATYGVVSLNNELEKTRISLGSILQVAGEAPNIGTGIEYASSLMEKMRKDAASLPGSFNELLDIFRTVATSGFNAGADSEKIRTMAQNAMAAGAVMGLRSDMVGRELAQTLEGKIGAHNIFATRLGLTGGDAEKFKHLEGAKRLEEIERRLTQYAPAIAAFNDSFQAQFTTALDNGKKFLEMATAPLFDRAKHTLGDINTWFDNNQEKVKHYADVAGDFLAAAFDKGKAIVLEYGPPLAQFAENAYTKLVGIWNEIQPAVTSFGEALKEALRDPGTIDKLIDLAKLYAAIKIGGPLVGAMGGLGGAGGAAGAGTFGRDEFGRLTVGGGGNKLAGALGGAAMGYGAASIAGLLAGDAVNKGREDKGIARGFGATGVGAAGGFAMGGPIGAIVGALVGAGKSVLDTREEALSTVTELQTNYTQDMVANLAALSDSYGQIKTDSTAYQMVLQSTRENMGDAAAAALELAVSAQNASATLADVANRAYLKDWAEELGGGYDERRREADAEYAARGKKAGPSGGGKGAGTTNITVNMTVSSNQAPGQIARRVVDILGDLKRNPKSSAYAPNYSATSR